MCPFRPIPPIFPMLYDLDQVVQHLTEDSDAETEPVWGSSGGAIGESEVEIYDGDIGEIGICSRDHALDAALGTGQFTLFMAPVHIGLPPDHLARLERLRAAGELIGIETLAPAKRRFPAPVSAGATWQLARSLLGRAGPVPPTPMTVEEALNWALREGGANRVITTTTRLDHLESNVYAVTSPSTGRLITA